MDDYFFITLTKLFTHIDDLCGVISSDYDFYMQGKYLFPKNSK